MSSETKLAKAMERVRSIQGRLSLRNQEAKHHGKIPGILTPVISALGAAASAYTDGRMGTADNKHPASFIAAALGMAGAVAGAVAGQPTLGQTAASLAAGPISFLSGMAAYERGKAAADKAAAADGGN